LESKHKLSRIKQSNSKISFPITFIDQVLDTLIGNKYFSFLDGFSGYNHIQHALEDQDNTSFACPWGMYSYRVLPFGLFNAPAAFHRSVLGIFSNLIHDFVEVYMDDFFIYGNNFEAMEKLEKLLVRCKEDNVSLSNEKWIMMFNEWNFLGNHISGVGIKVDSSKVEVISKIMSKRCSKSCQRKTYFATMGVIIHHELVGVNLLNAYPKVKEKI